MNDINEKELNNETLDFSKTLGELAGIEKKVIAEGVFGAITEIKCKELKVAYDYRVYDTDSADLIPVAETFNDIKPGANPEDVMKMLQITPILENIVVAYDYVTNEDIEIRDISFSQQINLLKAILDKVTPSIRENNISNGNRATRRANRKVR